MNGTNLRQVLMIWICSRSIAQDLLSLSDLLIQWSNSEEELALPLVVIQHLQQSRNIVCPGRELLMIE